MDKEDLLDVYDDEETEDCREDIDGCVLGDRCLNYNIYHFGSECISIEMVESAFAEQIVSEAIRNIAGTKMEYVRDIVNKRLEGLPAETRSSFWAGFNAVIKGEE